MTQPPLGEQAKACLGLAASRTGVVVVASLLNAVFDLDNMAWVDALIRVGVPARAEPSAGVEAAEQSLGVRDLELEDGWIVAASTTVHRVVRRGQDYAGALGAQSTAPAHLVLAVLDEAQAAANLPSTAARAELRAAIGDVVLGTDLPDLTDPGKQTEAEPSPEALAVADAVPEDLAKLLAGVAVITEQRGSVRVRRRRRRTNVVISVGAVVLLAATVTALGLHPPWVKPARQRAVEHAERYARLGQPAQAVRSFGEALEDSPSYVRALHGMTCELWAIGYRDDAMRYLQRLAIAGGNSQPRWEWGDGACVADDPARYGIGYMESELGPILAATPTRPSEPVRQLVDLTRGQSDGSLILMVASCINERAGLHLMATYQLATASKVGDAKPTGTLRTCTKAIREHTRGLGQSGSLSSLPEDVRVQVFVPGRSPIPAPKIVELPPRDR